MKVKTRFVFIFLCLIILISGISPYKIIISIGKSMLPTFSELDILLVKEIAPEELRVNDIGIYQHPEKKNFINHRVIIKTQEGYYFKGDGNDYLEYVPKEFVRYIVVKY